MRLLVARAGALGDLLLLRRTLAALSAAGHDVTLLAPGPGALLCGDGEAHARRHLPWDAPDLAALLGGGRVPEGPAREALRACDLALAYTRSVDLVHGLARVIPLAMARDPAPDPAQGSAALWLARPLEVLGLDPRVPPPVEAPTDDERRAAAPWLARLGAGFLALHPGSGSRAKNWPFERFLELASALSPERPWLLLLGPAEERMARARTPALERAVVARELPLGTLRALVSQARLYVGNDAGVTHLAAACGTPTLALFGPTDPRVWAPDGPRVTCLRAADGELPRLGVAEALAAARALAGGVRR